LVRFAAGLIRRLLVTVAPYLAAMALVALALPREYDINYYLTARPPVFILAVTVIGLIAAAGAWVLVRRLAGWAIAMPLAVIAGEPVGESFAKSAALLAPLRRRVVADVALWAASRVAVSTAAALVAGFLMNGAIALSGEALGALAVAALGVLILWWLIDTGGSALANAALAVQLTRFYAETTGDAPPPTPPAAPDAAEARAAALPVGAALLCGVAVVVVSILGADRLAARADAERDVAIIAHRGAAGARPENTLAAIRKAVEDRADWVEIDVQETADGALVVAHDSDFMKQARNPLKVWNATRADLAGIDIGGWFDPAYAGERPPMLEDALAAVRGRAGLLIELKYYGHDVALERRVAEAVEAAGMVDAVAVMSLKRRGVERFAALRPDWPRGVLSARAIGDLTRLDVDFIAVNAGQASVGLIRRAHGRGKRVYVWTVNDPLAMTRLISMGVDGLITDEPALARRVIESRAGLSGTERLALWVADRFRVGRFALVVDEGDA
jgi:glycerophosphoryl diester phosphodiesterase